MKLRLLSIALALVALVAVQRVFAVPDTKPGPDVKCPVSGKAVNPDATVDFGGGKVYLCCNNCPAAFKKDTAKYAAKANHQLVQTGQLKQVACPFTGKPTNESTAIDVAGVKVAFCCNNCKGKAEKATGDEQIELVFKDVSKGFKASN